MNYAVIDLSNLFHRIRHAVMGDAETKAGAALHTVFRSLRKMHREFKIDHMVFCVDNSSWRYDVYPEYKALRKLNRSIATPAEQEENEIFFSTLNDFISYLENSTKCTVLNLKNIEGDDFVARWVQTHPDDQHIIVSGDSDFIQLMAPNVKIYDGVTDRLISIDSIYDFQKKTNLEFTVAPGSGKLKVGVPNKNFVPEADWWKKALFVKIIRGDSGDSIFSCNPGVRFKGSTKRIGIEEAWNDRVEKGFHWNNFMLQSWSKLIGVKDDERITQDVVVKDEFKINESLIDLSKQPDDIKILMDEAIEQATQKYLSGNVVGIHFLKFCKKFDLPNLLMEATDHVLYLNAPYKSNKPI